MSFIPKVLILIGWTVLIFSLEVVDFTKDTTKEISNGRDKESTVITFKIQSSATMSKDADGNPWTSECAPKNVEVISLPESVCYADQTSTGSEEKAIPFWRMVPKLANGGAGAANNGTLSAVRENAIRTAIALIIIIHIVLLRGQLSV